MILGALLLFVLVFSAVATTLLALAMLICGEQSWSVVFGVSQVLWITLAAWVIVVNILG